MKRVFRDQDKSELAQAAAAFVLEKLRARLESAARVSLALSGGNSPLPAYQVLARASFPWERVDFFFADERCVPPDHKDSNFKVVNDALFVPLKAKPAQIFRMKGELEDLDAAAREYEQSLPAQLDVVVLGMGDDGHTCSLFPNHPQVKEMRRVAVVTDSPKPPPRRLTLTPRALAGATLLMVVTGEGKAHAAQRALETDGSLLEVPARVAQGGTWFLDAAAASQLKAG